MARLRSLPRPCLLSQVVDRWFRPESDPPVRAQPGGASKSDSPGGHLPPIQASQLPLPWQQLDSRSQGKAPPGSAQHSQTSEGGTQRDRGPGEAASRGLGEVGMRGRELGSRKGCRKDRDGEERGDRERDRNQGGRMRPRKEGGQRERGPEERRCSPTETGGWEDGRREREAAKSDGAGEGRGGSWPGEAGAGVAQPCPAGLAQPPVTVQLPHLGPTTRSVLPWG